MRSSSRLTFVNLWRFRTSSSDHGHGAPAAFARRICSRVLSMRRNFSAGARAAATDVGFLCRRGLAAALPRVVAQSDQDGLMIRAVGDTSSPES